MNAAFDDRPSRLGLSLSLLTGAFTVAALLAAGSPALVALASLLVVGYGVHRGDGRAVTLGGVGLFAGVLLAGAVGAPTGPVLVAAVGAVVTWDVADQAVGLGRQVGRRADSSSAELVHAAGSALLATCVAALAYAAFLTLGSSSSLALVLLVLGAVLIAATFRG